VNVVPRLSAALLAALRDGDYAAAMAVWESIRFSRNCARMTTPRTTSASLRKPLASWASPRGTSARRPGVLPGDRRDQVAGLIASWKEEAGYE